MAFQAARCAADLRKLGRAMALGAAGADRTRTVRGRKRQELPVRDGSSLPRTPALTAAERARILSPEQFRGKGGAMDQGHLGLLQGTLDMLVLRALLSGPLHGYGVARWIRDTTEGALEIEEGALYTALHRMERREWLRSEWGLSENNRRAKFYALTDEGRRQMAAGAQSWTRYAEAVFKILRASEARA
jgi:PadR family transcriptional regulator PadR